ncbi:MAG: sugar phosphate nucleotidyltransferase, partial [Candidatus Limousia pullorum]
EAACTIAVIDVPLSEASRFGILNTNPDGSIYEFDEKPAVPKSTNASMGIYVFSWGALKKYLIEDEADPNSSNDFGKNVLPAMLNAGERMFAYPFEGYWKDVGTIDSLWESNMDLLDPNTTLDLKNIYSRNPMMPPHHIGEEAEIQNSLIADGCNVDGKLEFSVLFAGVKVGKGAVVNSSIIMPGAVVEEGAVVQYAIVSENSVIGKNAVVGANPEDVENRADWGIAVIGDNLKIGEGVVVPPKAMIDHDMEV